MRFRAYANGAVRPKISCRFINGSTSRPNSSSPTIGTEACAIMPKHFFGPTITLSTGRIVPVRLIAEQHVIEDLGFIPSFADWVRAIKPEPWMGRAQPIHSLVDPFAITAAAV